MSSGGRNLGCRARAALFAALAGGPAWGPAWAAQDATQAPVAASDHTTRRIFAAEHRIDPILPDLHGGVWQVLHGRPPPDEARWHPTSYRPDAEAFDVTSVGAPQATPLAPAAVPPPAVSVAPPQPLAVTPPLTPPVTPPVTAPVAPPVALRAPPPVAPIAPPALPPAVPPPAAVAAVVPPPPAAKPVPAPATEAKTTLPYGLRPRQPIEEAGPVASASKASASAAAPAVAIAPAGAHGHCLVHSNDVAVMRARLKACVTAALALSTRKATVRGAD